MPWIFDTRAAPMTNPWSWQWDEPNDRIGYAPDGSMYESSPEPVLTGMPSADETIIVRSSPYLIPHGPHQADRSNSLHNDEDYVHTRRSQEQEVIQQDRADIMLFAGPPRQSAPPAARAHDDDNEAVIVTAPTFRTGAECPKARIQHGRAGDDILMRYYLRHDTFNGAEVYIEPNVCHNAAARAQWPMAQIEHGNGEDELLKRYYLEHNTFAGAMVYIKPNMDSEQED